jgi:putative inorganic carbon (HCO3(-)) transporter
VVLEPALFYMLLRFMPLETKDIWRIVDFMLLGALIVAVYGLSNLVTGDNLITAEGGIARIRSIYGSPNNLGLYLGRAIAIAGAVAFFGRQPSRRLAYGLALLPLVAAAGLSLSRGALFLGLPAIVAVLLLFWGGRRAALALAGLGSLAAVALIPLSRLARFADVFSTSTGTSFLRINVWRSAWAMFVDHPVSGVGLDNFLYAYRGRYIQPEAWQDPDLPHAHNVFLDALTRTGLLGLAALLWMLGAVLYLACVTLKRLTDRDLRALTIGLLACLADSLAHGQVDTAYWFVDLAFVFMLVLGLMSAIYGLAVRAEPAGIICSPQIRTE